MATTHVLAGMCLGLALAPLAPVETTTLVAAGAIGGVIPDADALGNHRKDLHAPVYGSVAALLALGSGVFLQSTWLFVAAALLGGAGLHAIFDAFGGGRSLRPWAESVDRAVYCHAQGRWWRPRRWISYDGSPADLGAASLLAAAVLVHVDSLAIQGVVVALVVLSTVYVALRKRVPDYVGTLQRRIDRRVRHSARILDESRRS